MMWPSVKVLPMRLVCLALWLVVLLLALVVPIRTQPCLLRHLHNLACHPSWVVSNRIGAESGCCGDAWPIAMKVAVQRVSPTL
jgi:hypothetical protein